MTSRPVTCSVCGTQIEQRTRGRGRLYCSNVCRVKSQRRRRAIAEFEALPDSVAAVPVTTKQVSFDEQVAQALIEARAAGFAMQRLGTQARPELAWRCTNLGNAIVEAIRSTFPEIER